MNLLYFWTGGGGDLWEGSTAEVGVAGISGEFTQQWDGNTAEVGVAGIGGVFLQILEWHGSTATIGVRAQSGAWSGIGRAAGRTGVTIIRRTRTEMRAGRHRTAMTVGAGRARTEV